MPAFPDSAQALRRLSSRYQLIILSNVDRAGFAGSKKRLGVTFTSILTAQDIGSYKPSPGNFEALSREGTRLGIGAGRLVIEQKFGRMAALQGTKIIDVALADAVGNLKTLDPDYLRDAAEFFT